MLCNYHIHSTRYYTWYCTWYLVLLWSVQYLVPGTILV